MSWFKSWLPTLVAIGGAALAIVAPPLQAVIAAHPAVSIGLSALYAILSHLLPSPVASGK